LALNGTAGIRDQVWGQPSTPPSPAAKHPIHAPTPLPTPDRHRQAGAEPGRARHRTRNGTWWCNDPVMSVFKGSGRRVPPGYFRPADFFDAGMRGGGRATVDHAVIRGLVTARPWCVAGLPLSCCGIRVPGTLSRVALTGPALRRACQMMIRAGLVSRWDDRARSSRQLASADAARVYSGCRARRHGFPRLAVRRARAALWTPVDKPLSMPSLL
jgi:hypothetical protein